MKPERVKAFFSRKLNAPAEIRRLKGGIWNESFLVKARSGKLVAKVFSSKPDSAFYKNSGWVEWRTLRLLEPLEIAPKPLLFASRRDAGGAQILAYEFAEGKPGGIRGGDIARAARLIASFHEIRPSPSNRFISKKDYSAQGLSRDIEARLSRLERKIPASKELAAFRKYFERAAGRKSPPYSPRLVHTDLVPGNFIQGAGGRLKLIDWQSPAFGDPAFDVWAFCSDAFQLWDLKRGLGESERRKFLEEYLRARKDKSMRARLEAKTQLFALVIGLHYLERLTDFMQGRIPKSATAGKESLFRKYELVKNACLKELESA